MVDFSDAQTVVVLFYLFVCCNYVRLVYGYPGMYIFGDSLLDVGNNDLLINSHLKANFPPYGVDIGKATGRFSNGKNSADFLAEKLGLPSTPAPYLALIRNSSKAFHFHKGVSFASGGAGILNTTFYYDSICLENQLGYFRRVHNTVIQQLGLQAAAKHFASSIFVITIGSNDLFVYFTPGSNLTLSNTPQQYINSMVSNFQVFVNRLYNLGARKFLISGTGAVGCCPAQRALNNTECREDVNLWSARYNDELRNMLLDFKLDRPEINYSFFHTYTLFSTILQNPRAYGFTETKVGCCGAGGFCVPNSMYCPNRSDHIFWDLFHPTSAASAIFAETAFSGYLEYATPMNLQQLLELPINYSSPNYK